MFFPGRSGFHLDSLIGEPQELMLMEDYEL